MTDRLEMPLEQFVEAVAKENARLTEENKKLVKEYQDLRKIFDDTVGKLVSEKIARDIVGNEENARLTECLKVANEKHEHFEREWYLAKDRIEQLEEALRKINERLNDSDSWLAQSIDARNFAETALKGNK